MLVPFIPPIWSPTAMANGAPGFALLLLSALVHIWSCGQFENQVIIQPVLRSTLCWRQEKDE